MGGILKWHPIATEPNDGFEFQVWIAAYKNTPATWEPYAKMKDGVLLIYDPVMGGYLPKSITQHATHWALHPSAPGDDDGT